MKNVKLFLVLGILLISLVWLIYVTPSLQDLSGTLFEGFESGSLITNNWTSSGGTNNWQICSTGVPTGANDPYAGTYSACVEETGAETILVTNISTINYKNITFSFYAKTEAFDGGEYIAADWHNGTTWNTALPQTQTIATYTFYSYNLNSSANNNSNLRIRFRCMSDSNNEFCYVDNINVTGDYTLLNSVPTHTTPLLNSTDGSNYTSQNLTCYNQSTADNDGNPVKNIFNWKLNESSITLLNMPFEGKSNSTWTRDYAIGNNGNVTTATWNSTGGYDERGAYQFDGSTSYINLGNDSSMDYLATGSYTWTAWIKKDIDNDAMAIISKSTAPTNAKGYEIIITASNLLAFQSRANMFNQYHVYSNSTIDTGVWTHVAVVYDNLDVSLYLDGILSNSSSVTDAEDDTSTSMFIGMGHGSTGAPNTGVAFNGSIDEVLLFNKTLSAEQIYAIYQNRTDLIVSQELSVGQNWTCEVTPNDGLDDGVTLESNNLIILADTTPPTINITYPANTTYTINVSELNYTSSETGYCWYSRDSGAINSSAVSSGINFTNVISVEGNNTWTLYCNDTTGNENSTSVTFSVDTTVTPPAPTPSSGGGGGTIYWKCEIWKEWGECLDNKQIRECEKKVRATYSTQGDLIEYKTCEETEKALFDVVVSTLPESEEIFSDTKEISFQIDLTKFNLPEELTEVKINYKINNENEIIHEESENLEVQKATSFIKTISLPELNPGSYQIDIQIEYSGEIAEGKTNFVVKEKKKSFTEKSSEILKNTKDKISNFLKTTKSKIYLFAGALLVLIIGIILFLKFRKRNFKQKRIARKSFRIKRIMKRASKIEKENKKEIEESGKKRQEFKKANLTASQLSNKNLGVTSKIGKLRKELEGNEEKIGRLRKRKGLSLKNLFKLGKKEDE